MVDWSVCNLIRRAAHCKAFMYVCLYIVYVLERKFWCVLSYALLVYTVIFGLGWGVGFRIPELLRPLPVCVPFNQRNKDASIIRTLSSVL